MTGTQKRSTALAKWLIPLASIALAAGGLMVRTQFIAKAGAANCVKIDDNRESISTLRVSQARTEERLKAMHSDIREIKAAVKR